MTLIGAVEGELVGQVQGTDRGIYYASSYSDSRHPCLGPVGRVCYNIPSAASILTLTSQEQGESRNSCAGAVPIQRADNPGSHAIRSGCRNGRYELYLGNNLHAFERYAPNRVLSKCPKYLLNHL